MLPSRFQISLATFAVAAVLASLPNNANATLVAGDSSFGAGSVTVDSSQQLEFSDLTHTTGLSFTQVTAQLGAGGTFEGFRPATLTEFLTLVDNSDFSGPVDVSAGTAAAGNTSDTSLASLIDLLSDPADPTNAFVSFATGTPAGSSVVGGFLTVNSSIFNGSLFENSSFSASLAVPVGTTTTPTLLVRAATAAVPEPTAALFGALVTTGLALNTRRRGN